MEEAAAAALRPFGVRRVPFNFQLGSWRIFSLSQPLLVMEWQGVEGQEIVLPDMPEQADGVLLEGVPAPGDARPMVRVPAGWSSRRLRAYPRHLAEVNTRFEIYFAKFSGKTRSTLKRKLRKFEALSGGAIDWRSYRSPQELETFLPLAHALSAKTYQARLLHAGLPESEAFRAEALARAEAGRVRAYLLFLHERPVSYLYLPVEGRTAVYAYLGYDPEIASHSPGTVLHLLAIETLCDDPSIDMLDFTAGAGEHKELFATRTEQCVDLLVLRPGSRAARIAGAHRVFMACEGALARLLDRLHIKRALKMAMRGTARRGR